MSDEHDKNALDGEMMNGEHQGTGLVIPDSVLPSTLYLLPALKRPFFPSQIQPIVLDMQVWQETVRRVANMQDKVVGLMYCEDAAALERWGPGSTPDVGCAVRVHQAHQEKDTAQLVVQGLKRFRIRRWLNDKPPYLVEVDYPDNVGERDSDEVKAYGMAIIKAIKELLAINPLYSEELKHYLTRFSPNEPSLLVDFAAAISSSASGRDLQGILETIPLLRRMEKVLTLLTKEREVAELQGRISEQVNEKISENQRKFFLKEQLKVIQRELGISKDDRTADAELFRDNLANKVLPEAAKKRIDEEIGKLEVLERGSPEYAVTRNYLDWATQLPWGVYSEDKLDLPHARRILAEHHHGLDDVKERIVEFLAVGKFKGSVAGSIILLVGPPGVGKTSIGRSIAEALGRKFYRFSLGGMRDEAEIKGHRRTYIGAMPGKLVQALKEVETANPVIMLDEIDKLGASYQGDPASAMLEVLDPEQNSEFLDHYLDLRLDLSKVLFICTANQLDSIPGPLLDRMEVIRLAGYLAEEKLAIARQHLWPRLLQRNGIDKKQLAVNVAALRHVIDGYAREAGVRGLEKQLGRLVRKSAVKLLESDQGKITLGKADVEAMLGKPLFKKDKPQRGVGVVTGLAWTAMGGATLGVECSRIHSLSRGFQLSGQLGDVMKESAASAYGHVMSNLKRFGADEAFFNESQIHLHVPEGATPKDGPSAGITMASALLSLALNRAPKPGYAMTGELTLTGQVLPVGGIREKVIAAKRSGIRKIILPEDNRRDAEELPDYVRKGIDIYFASHFDEVRERLF
ncbi:MAG: endopeptidase La [Spongiibacter sp.]|nr:endopeptidase La [Spongiibacter sp.]